MAKRKRYACGGRATPLTQRASDDLDALLSELSPAKGNRRRELHALIQARLTDPGQLADSPALPAGHPLRRQADTVRRLFNAVTTAPLPPGALADLDTIPRQSPLAPWKLLIRALDAFYRRADTRAEANLARIPTDSGPGRLVPVLRALLAGTRTPAEAADFGPDTPAAALVEQVSAGSHGRRLQLSRALSRGDGRAVRRLLPWLAGLPTAHRHTFIRTLLDHWQRNGGLPPGLIDLLSHQDIDPELPRLAALSLEHSQWDGALLVWDAYLSAAQAADRLSPGSPETVRILLHMSELFPTDRQRLLDDLDVASEHDLRHALRSGRLPAVFDRAAVLERARQAVGCVPARLGARVFAATVAYYAPRDAKRAEAEAEAWHAAYPDDLEPLLYLIEAAEKRGALRKALGFVAKAEALNRLHPQLRDSRFRLLLASAERRIRDARAALATADLERLAQEPQASDGDTRAYLLALNWALAQKMADTAGAQTWAETLARTVNNQALHALILATVSEMTKVARPRWSASVSPPQAVEGLVRACTLFGALDRRVCVPDSFVSQVEKNLDGASVAQLHALCHAGLAIGRPTLTYIAAGRGLGYPGPDLHRFLLARGNSLAGSPSPPDQTRSRNCLRAARELAERARDTQAAGHAAAALDALPAWTQPLPPGASPHRSPSQAQIELTLEVERHHPRPPCLAGQTFAHTTAMAQPALP